MTLYSDVTLEQAIEKAKALGAKRMAHSWIGDNRIKGTVVFYHFLDGDNNRLAMWAANANSFLRLPPRVTWQKLDLDNYDVENI